MISGLYLWADAMVGQIRICQVVTDIAIKNCDTRNWLNMDAVPDECSEPRLDPFEFHGRRCSSDVPQQADTANASRTRKTNRPQRRM